MNTFTAPREVHAITPLRHLEATKPVELEPAADLNVFHRSLDFWQDNLTKVDAATGMISAPTITNAACPSPVVLQQPCELP